MKRFVIMTVGKTHSGKSTFAKVLNGQLPNSVVIDQDYQAEFINRYYRSLQPDSGPNTLKHAMSQTIVDYAMKETDFHLIICNSNRSRNGRIQLLNYFKDNGFATILVYFEIPFDILKDRVAVTKRSTSIFRSAATFDEVLARQEAEVHVEPGEEEADQLFTIKNEGDIQTVISSILSKATVR